MSDAYIQLDGKVQIIPRRRWWQLWKVGWHRHHTAMGPAWIRYVWGPDEDGERFHVAPEWVD